MSPRFRMTAVFSFSTILCSCLKVGSALIALLLLSTFVGLGNHFPSIKPKSDLQSQAIDEL